MPKEFKPYSKEDQIGPKKEKKSYQLKRTPIKKKYKPKENKAELDAFFDEHVALIKRYNMRSMESGKPIINPTRCNVCHILPKSVYKSVACDKYNIIYLTLDEHTRFDELLSQHRFLDLSKEFPRVMRLIKDALYMLNLKVREKGKLLTEIINYYDEPK